ARVHDVDRVLADGDGSRPEEAAGALTDKRRVIPQVHGRRTDGARELAIGIERNHTVTPGVRNPGQAVRRNGDAGRAEAVRRAGEDGAEIALAPDVEERAVRTETLDAGVPAVNDQD